MMTMVAAMRTVVVVVSNGDDGSGNEGGELIDDEDDGREGGGVDDGGEAPVVKMGKRVEDGDVLPKEGRDVRRRTARQKGKEALWELQAAPHETEGVINRKRIR